MCTDLVTGLLSVFTTPAALILRCSTQQTNKQYSYYPKNAKGYLSSEIICVEHYTRIGPAFQNTHIKNQSAIQLEAY